MLPGDENPQRDQLPHGFTIAKRYEIESFIGTGGMGSVYLAYDRLLESHVAIKVLHKEFIRDPNLTKRFMREVKLMHTVNHPNVVRTFDIGVEENLIYYSMELVQGCMLDEYLGRVGNHSSIIARLTIQLCRGLEAIHKAKIVHRDLKPSNILVADEGCVKITDFGVARPTTSTFTAHREIMGSLDYLPPEVVTGGEISYAVDFYSLGIILYEMTTGAVPFEADDLATLMWMHVHKIPEEPRTLKRDIPPWLNDLIMSLIQKQPDRRPRNANEIISRITPHLTKDVTLTGEDAQGSAVEYSLGSDAKEEEESEPRRTQEKQAQVTTQDAMNNILFDVLPTMNEILEHEKKFSKEKVRRVPSGQFKAIPAEEEEEPEEDELEAMRLLRKSVYVLAVVMLIVLGTLIYFLYNYFAGRKTEYWFPRGDSPSSSQYQSAPTQTTSSAAPVEQQDPTAIFTNDSVVLAVERFKKKFASSPATEDAFQNAGSSSQSAQSVSQPAQEVAELQSSASDFQGTTSQPEPLKTWQQAIPYEQSAPVALASPGIAGAVSAPKPASEKDPSKSIYTPELVPQAFNAAESAPKQKSMSGLFDSFKKFLVTPDSALSSSQATYDAEVKFREVLRLERSIADLEVRLSVAALGAGERTSKRLAAIDAEEASLRDSEEKLRAALREDKKRYEYWSYLAGALDDKDILSLSQQLNGASQEVETRREAYREVSSQYFSLLEAPAAGKGSVAERDAVGKDVAIKRKSLRDEVASIIEKSLAEQIAATTNRSMAFRAVEDKKRQLALERTLLQSAGEDSSQRPAKAVVQRERDSLASKLAELKATISANDESILRRASAMERAQ